MARLSWVVDGVTGIEHVRLWSLYAYVHDDLPWLDPEVREQARGLARSFLDDEPESEETWIKTDVLLFSTGLSDTSGGLLYDDFVQSPFTQSATVSLPLAGDVNLWIFQPTPFPPDEDLLAMLEDSVRLSEDFMGAPFPVTDVIMLVPIISPGIDHRIGGGGYWGAFIHVTRYEPIPADREPIYHEVATTTSRAGSVPRGS